MEAIWARPISSRPRSIRRKPLGGEGTPSSSVTRPRWGSGEILRHLPHLSALPLASECKAWLQSKMEMTSKDGTCSLELSRWSRKEHRVLSGWSGWRDFVQYLVSGEERQEVAAVLERRVRGGDVSLAGTSTSAGLGLGEEKEWRHLLSCFLIALLPSSLPNFDRLKLADFLPKDISLEEAEEAVVVLWGAFLAHQREPSSSSSSTRHLALWYDDAYGSDKACGHLAHLLRSTHFNLRTLHFFDVDSLDADGIGQIAWALQSNELSTTRLTKLIIEDCPRVGDRGVEKLADMLRTNGTLQELGLISVGMTGEGVGHLRDALYQSQSTSLLNISLNLGIGAHAAVGNLLARNLPLLRNLKVRNCDLDDKEGHLARGLQKNNTVQHLDLSFNDRISSKDWATHILPTLASNQVLQTLDISGCKGVDGKEVQTALSDLLRVNATLLHLNLCYNDGISSQDWATHILPALASNQVLLTLDIRNCNGVDGKEVQTALLDLLRVNTTLQRIGLSNTPLDRSGKAAAVLELLARNKEYGKLLSSMPTSKPRSCRIILCGEAFAGKSTLLRTLKGKLKGKAEAESDQDQQVCDRTESALLRTLKGMLMGKAEAESDQDQQVCDRTRGIDICLLKDEQDGLRMSVWDFAGQREYHALHQVMFPTGNQGAATIFVYTFNPIDQASGQVKLKEEPQFTKHFSYWLKFVASNSRPDPPHPQVVVVITHRDKFPGPLSQDPWGWITKEYQTAIEALEEEYHDVLHVRLETPFVVNAEDVNDGDISLWMEYMDKAFGTMLAKLPRVPSICDNVAKALQAYVAAPIVPIKLFADTCMSIDQDWAELLKLSGDREPWRIVAAYLHNAGELIYRHELLFIVQNLRWFGHGILGHLIDLFSQDSNLSPGQHQPSHQPSRRAYFSRRTLESLLKDSLRKTVPGRDLGEVNVDDLIALMLLLRLCYQKKTGDSKSVYLVPAIFDNPLAAVDRRQLKWRVIGPNAIFAGWRLQPEDAKRTILTDGFFPLLQVVLHKYAQDNWCAHSNDGKDICRLGKNLFTVLENGMEIIVEYSCFRFSVDILVQSSHKPHKEMKKFVQDHFIHTIRQACASQEGCQGVNLCEFVIRPACCGAGGTDPVLCEYRNADQVISVSELMRKTETESNYVKSWGEVEDGKGNVLVPAGNDSATYLLGEEDHPSTARASDLVTRNDPADSLGQLIYVTTHDLPMCDKIIAGAWISGVVPLRFHLECGWYGGHHRLKEQPGRTFYLVNNVIYHALEKYTRRGVVVSLAALLGSFPHFGGLGSALKDLPQDSTAIYRISTETFSDRINDKASKQERVKQWRSLVEAEMQNSLTGSWMKAFLHSNSSCEAVNAFKSDFMLTLVRYKADTRPPAWLCDEHFKQDYEQVNPFL